jgi:hypothetical protein
VAAFCWQVGNHVVGGEVVPLDAVLYPIFKATGLKLRNRIIWHYEHGLHASRRFSSRYETKTTLDWSFRFWLYASIIMLKEVA